MTDVMFCFIDKARVCGGDCMAYQAFPRENKELQEMQTHCMLLSSIERIGRSTTIGMSHLVKLQEMTNKEYIDRKNREMDAQRRQSVVVPEVK